MVRWRIKMVSASTTGFKNVLNFDTMNSKIFKDEKDIWFNHYKAEAELKEFDNIIKKHII